MRMTPTHPIKPNPMPAAAAAAPDTQGLQTGLPTVLVWAFRLFVFSIPFETANRGEGEGGVQLSLSKITGYLFFLVCLCYGKWVFQRVHPAVFLFSFYNILRVIYLLFIPPDVTLEAASSILTLLQMLVLFHIGFNLLRSRDLAWDFLLTLAIACAALACTQAAGITSAVHADPSRTTALAENPNVVAMTLGLGLAALVGWLFRTGPPSPLAVLAFVPLLLVISYEIIVTGSRGGFLSLLVGLSMVVLGLNTLNSAGARIGLAAGAVVALLFLATTSDYLVERWTRSIEEGSLANRERIFPIAWGLFLERPLTGWGPAHILRLIGHQLGKTSYSTHNLYLYLLGETGLLGTIPYLWALALCVRAAWRARSGFLGLVPLSLVTMVFINNMSDNWQWCKLHWLVLAFGLASELALRKAPSRRSDSAPSGSSLNGEAPGARGPEMAPPLRRAGA
jgi:O-antigen ligase